MAFSRLIQTVDAWGSQELGGNYSLDLISILSEMLEYLQSFKLQQIHVPKKKEKAGQRIICCALLVSGKCWELWYCRNQVSFHLMEQKGPLHPLEAVLQKA